MPAMFQAKELGKIHFDAADGLKKDRDRFDEPGYNFDGYDVPLVTFLFPKARADRFDIELSGADSDGTWTMVYTPRTAADGSLASTSMLNPAKVEFKSDNATTPAQAVAGLLEAVRDSATVLEPADIEGFTRMVGYGDARAVEGQPTRMTFSLRGRAKGRLTVTHLDSNGVEVQTATITVSSESSDDLLYIGGYCTIDRNAPRGEGSHHYTVRPVLPGDAANPEDIVGPIGWPQLPENTREGECARRIKRGVLISVPREGTRLAIGGDACAQGSAVFVRHTQEGDLLDGYPVGSIGDEAMATATAVAGQWTLANDAVNNAQYQARVTYGSITRVIETTSDASADAVEISDTLREQLLGLRFADKMTLTDLGFTFSAAGQAVITINGPESGDPLTIVPTPNLSGTLTPTIVEAPVTEYIRTSDVIIRDTEVWGGVPVRVPSGTRARL